MRVNRVGEVRVITGETEACLTGAAGLASKGVDVRIARTLESDNLSYHVFTGNAGTSTIINHREDDRDRPVRLNGIAPSRVYRGHVAALWDASVPVESVLADRAVRSIGHIGNVTRNDVVRRVQDLKSIYQLDSAFCDEVLTHTAFLHAASTVFVVGLPGAGKSLVRHHLANLLRARRLKVEELSDYVYLYRDFLHGKIRLSDRGAGFTADGGGAFWVGEEGDLRPALHAVAERVWENQGKDVITLVEFARSDILTALQEFGDRIVSRAHVIHIEASTQRRQARLEQRATPPHLEISDELSITVNLSDNHRLPSTASQTLYTTDDFAKLEASPAWHGRTHRLNNDFDSISLPAIDQALREFIQDVAAPYLSTPRERRDVT